MSRAENKTITGMTNEMPNASDQSCLNRFLTEVEWDENAVRIVILWRYKNDKKPRKILVTQTVNARPQNRPISLFFAFFAKFFASFAVKIYRKDRKGFRKVRKGNSSKSFTV